MIFDLLRLILLLLLNQIAFCSRIKATTTSDEVEPTPSTIIDILSSKAEYSYFLSFLQRNELIPYVNSLENVTILVPINSAFSGTNELHSKEDLNRYLLDSIFRVGYMGFSDAVFTTVYEVHKNKKYLISISPDFTSKEYVIDKTSSIVDYDIFAKHQHSFIQSIDHILPTKPSICDIVMNDIDDTFQNITIFKRLIQSLFSKVETSKYPGGYEWSRDLYSHSSGLQYPKSCDDLFERVRTLIIPTDEYIMNSLPKITLDYYLSLTTAQDFAVTEESVHETRHDIYQLLTSFFLEHIIAGANSTTGSHQSLNRKVSYKVSKSNSSSSIILNDYLVSKENHTMIFGDVIVHVFDKNDAAANFVSFLGIPIVEMIPRKALFALHFSKYVRELYFRSMTAYIDGSMNDQTILLEASVSDNMVDDALMLASAPVIPLSFSQKQELEYQFLVPKMDIYSEIKNSEGSNVHILLNSSLCSKKRIGDCFKVKFSASASEIDQVSHIIVNGDLHLLSEPIITEYASYYILKDEIFAPSSLRSSIVEVLSNGEMNRDLDFIDVDRKSLLQTFRYLSEFGLLSLADNGKGYSVFIPCGSERRKSDSVKGKDIPSPWNSLGLTLSYLQNNPAIFKEVLQSMFIVGDVYTDFGIQGGGVFNTYNLLNDPVEIHSAVHNDFENIILFNNTPISMPLNSDIFFSNGVIHITDRVLLPSWLKISLVDLLETTESKNFKMYSFLRLIENFPGMRTKLGIDNDQSGFNYSFLIPKPQSLSSFGIDENFEHLDDFLQFHLLPNSELPKLLLCLNSEAYFTNETYVLRTNLTDTHLRCSFDRGTGNFKLRLISPDYNEDSLHAVRYSKDHEVQILSHGCTSDMTNETNLDEISCVFLIEKPLNLDWLQKPDKFLHIHFGAISFAIGILLGVLSFSVFAFCIVVYFVQNRGQSIPNTSSPNILPAHSNPTFMGIRRPNDLISSDTGYETEEDMDVRPVNPILQNSKYRNYSATDNQDQVTAPRWIKQNEIIKGLNRSRNLPSEI